jgi:hypothetical protein
LFPIQHSLLGTAPGVGTLEDTCTLVRRPSVKGHVTWALLEATHDSSTTCMIRPQRPPLLTCMSATMRESRPGPWRLVSHVAGLPSPPWRRTIVYLASVKRRPVSSGRSGEDGVHQADFQLEVEQTNEWQTNQLRGSISKHH